MTKNLSKLRRIDSSGTVISNNQLPTYCRAATLPLVPKHQNMCVSSHLQQTLSLTHHTTNTMKYHYMSVT